MSFSPSDVCVVDVQAWKWSLETHVETHVNARCEMTDSTRIHVNAESEQPQQEEKYISEGNFNKIIGFLVKKSYQKHIVNKVQSLFNILKHFWGGSLKGMKITFVPVRIIIITKKQKQN